MQSISIRRARQAIARILVVLALVAAPATGPASAAGDSRTWRGEQRAIVAAADEWTAAYTSGDLERLMKLYMPDAVVALHGQPALRGLEQIRAYFAPRLGKGRTTFQLDVERIDVERRQATLLSAYWFTLERGADREPIRDAGRSLIVYRKDRDGRWKILIDIDQGTPDIAFPAPSSAR